MSTIKITTSLGDIKLKLYDQTPLHKVNFIKLVKSGFYNGTLFHRVIKNFMIQGGDPESRDAQPGISLGKGGPGYTIEAEIKPNLIHRRGAVAAARQSDEVNPEKRSSGSQFYITWGQIYDQNQLKNLQKNLAEAEKQKIFNKLVFENRSKILELRRNHDQNGLMELQNSLIAETQAILSNMETSPGLSEYQKEIYSTIGGVPHLDGEYTVFGEVTEGLDIIEKIQSVKTNQQDRPIEDIKIIKMEVLGA